MPPFFDAFFFATVITLRRLPPLTPLVIRFRHAADNAAITTSLECRYAIRHTSRHAFDDSCYYAAAYFDCLMLASPPLMRY